MTYTPVYLPDPVYEQLSHLAKLTGRGADDVAIEMLQQSLPNVDQYPSVRSLSDQEVLALTKIEMDAADDSRLSALLNKQQNDSLSGDERLDLTHLMNAYQVGLLQKANALAEAVKRGLIPPLEA